MAGGVRAREEEEDERYSTMLVRRSEEGEEGCAGNWRTETKV